MVFDKRYFDKVFEKEDPWGYGTCEYERVKHEREVKVVRQFCGHPSSILEIGCGEGTQTALLAGSFPEASILAVDISGKAVERARIRCENYPNVRVAEADVTRQFGEAVRRGEQFDAVLQFESLYYMLPGLAIRLAIGRYLNSLVDLLKEGGILVVSNGTNLPNRPALGYCYRVLRRRCDHVYKVKHREWNEVRDCDISYDIQVFRKR